MENTIVVFGMKVKEVPGYDCMHCAFQSSCGCMVKFNMVDFCVGLNGDHERHFETAD